VLQGFDDEDYRTVLQAWGDFRRDVAVVVDAHGRYQLPEGPATARKR
jgi:L-alanine-DL-glutamate epimerase-like enolase superfamily enzyme